MRVLEDVCDKLEGEIKQIVRKDDMNATDLDALYKAVDVVKDIKTIEAMEHSGYSNEYSYEGSYRMPRYSYADDNYSRDYYNDYSRARGGRDGDGDGRYSERGYSRHDENEHLMKKIDEMKRQLDNLR